jgi:hypothetical protein
MTTPEPDFSEALRHALAAVDHVEPAENGLDRIRARTAVRTPRRRLDAALAILVPWPAHRLLSYRTHLTDLLRAGWERAAGQRAHADGRRKFIRGNWVPVALTAAGVAFVATLALSVGPVRQVIFQIGSTGLSTNNPGSASGGTLNGGGTHAGGPGGQPGVIAGGSPGSQPGGAQSSGHISSPLQCPTTVTYSGGIVPTTTACPTNSPSVTSSPTSSASPTVSPSPSPSPSVSPSPSPSVSPSPSPSATASTGPPVTQASTPPPSASG